MYQIVGIEVIEYTSKKTGKVVKGNRLHLLSPPYSKGSNVHGSTVDTCFIGKPELLMGFEVGDRIELLYNKYGSVERIDLYTD